MVGRISIILTVHNDVQYIGESIESILKQTYKDIELIVVDDGSTDGTPELVAEIQDSRVRLLRPGRVGRGRALNIGIEECIGDLVVIQDSDDISHPRRLEVQAYLMCRISAISLLGTEYLVLRSSGYPVWPTVPDFPVEVREVTELLAFYNPVLHSSWMVRRDILKEIGGYEQERKSMFDYSLLVRAVSKGHRIHLVPTELVAKRIHARQQFERGPRILYVLEMLKLQGEAILVLKNKTWVFAFFPLLFLYRMLPQGLRMAAQKWTSLFRDSL
jgi:glycosyltransferase involved in cell wall biosynthesis